MSLAPEVLADYVRYTRWATAETLKACAALTYEELNEDMHTAYPTIWSTLVHLFQADSIWWSRFQQHPASLLADYNPGTDLDDLRARWMRLLDDVVSFAESRTEEQWREHLRFRNARGNEFEQPLWQLMMHVVNHGTLHRGQVLAMFRQLDRVPTSVDLINYYRRPTVTQD
ncbi:MAG: DinB family protein [Bryobacterales bacterium]|nr:DinB family protein [Bryobacterales bacterium]